jgi:hypothetical protein
MSTSESEKKGLRNRKQKEQDAPEVLVPEHKDNVQKGVPKRTEKGKQDKGDEKRQQSTTKTNKDEKQRSGDAPDEHDGNRHRKKIQSRGCQLHFKNILFAVTCACVIVILAVHVWQVDSHYRTEVAHLQEKVKTMEQKIKSNDEKVITMIKSNDNKLTNHDKKIQGLVGNVNNAATKQEVGGISSRITQLENKIAKCKC